MFEDYLIEEIKKHFPNLNVQKDEITSEIVIRSHLKNIRIAYNPEVSAFLPIICREYLPNEMWCKTSTSSSHTSIVDLIAYLTYAIHRL